MIQQVNGKAKFQQKLKKMKSKLPEKIYKSFTRQDITVVNSMGIQKYTNFQLTTWMTQH